MTLSADVYPLASGDRRTWRGFDGVVYSERVGAAVNLPAGPAYPVRSEDGSVEYLQRTATGVLSLPGPGSDVLAAAAGPIELLRFGTAVNQTIVLYDRTVAGDLDGDGRADGVDLRIESTFVGYEAVQTAIARHDDAAHVRTVIRSVARLAGTPGSTALTATSDDWYARGIGPVRNTISAVLDGGPAQRDGGEVFAYGVGALHSETVPPTLLSSSPVAGERAAPTARVVLNFSEPLDPLSLDGSEGIALFDGAGSVVPTTRTLEQNGQVVMLTPQSTLGDGSYEIRTGRAVTDLANNGLPPVVRPFLVDTQGPRVVSSFPAPDAIDVPVTATLKLVFDEPIYASPGLPPSLRLHSDSADQALPATIQGNELSVTLPAPLDRNTRYVLELSTPVVDGGGRPSPNARIAFRTDPGPLSRPVELVQGAFVDALTLADINADGLPDLVVAVNAGSGMGHYMAARLQQAGGRYAAPVRLATIDTDSGVCTPSGLIVGDADGDGRADIAITYCGGLKVLRQLASGEFAMEQASERTGSSRNAGGAINGDGRMMLVAGDRGEFLIRRRGVAGDWGTVFRVPIGSQMHNDVRLADVNGDGRLDLIWLHGDPEEAMQFAWAPGQDGGFGAPHRLPVDATGADHVVLAIGDVTGDGRADAIVAVSNVSRLGSRITVMRQVDGGFEAASTTDSSAQATALGVGDVDGDGRLDVVVAHNRASVGVLLQGSDGHLQTERLFESTRLEYDYSDAVAVVDLDADGRMDVVAKNDVLMGRPVTGPWPLRVDTAGRARAASAGASVDVSSRRPGTGALRALGLVRDRRGLR